MNPNQKPHCQVKAQAVVVRASVVCVLFFLFFLFYLLILTTHFRLIENKYFETVVLALILLSSAVMTLEDIWFETRPLLMDTLYYLDRILTVVFFLETDLKLFAMGCVMYFGNAWCWLDFVIVAVSLINFGASLLGAGNIPIFKTMRTLRALRPLRQVLHT